tara:strand:- start:1056 stop:1238 length:183 start_codon:yes stop_codon:yes gene_type:complete
MGVFVFMNTTITRGRLRAIIVEEVGRYIEKNKVRLLRESNISFEEVQELIRESLGVDDGN